MTSNPTRLLERWTDLMRRFAWAVVAVAVLATAAAGIYVARTIAINTNTVDMLSAELPFRQADRAMAAAFPQNINTIVVVVEGETPELAEAAGNALAAGFRARPSVFGPVFDPAGDPFFRRNGLLYLDVPQLESVVDQLSVAQPFIGALAADPSVRGLFNVLTLALEAPDGGDASGSLPLAMALDDMATALHAAAEGRFAPLSWQTLMFGAAPDPEQLRRIIVLNPPLDFASLQPAARAIAAIRELAETLALDPAHGVSVRLTGDAALADEELKSAQLDSVTPMLLSFAIVAMLAFLCFRAISLSLATLLTVLVGLVLTAAAALALVGTLNLLSVAFFVLFIGLAVDFGIHYTLRYKEGRDLRLDHAAALSRAATGVGGALALSAICAAIGFFAFLPTSYVGLAELGLIAGTGMAIALLVSLTALPAFLSIAPVKTPPAQPDTRTEPVLSRIRTWDARPQRVLAGAGVATALALALAPQARFDFDPMHLKDPNAESVETLNDLMRSGQNEAYAISALAADLPAAEAIAARAETFDVVAGARTLADFVPSDQDDKLAMVDTLALILEPSLSGPVAPPPSLAENMAALARLRAALVPLIATDQPTAAPAQRFLAGLDALAAGHSDRALIDTLDRTLLTGLPEQLDTVRRLLEARAIDLEDLPEDLRQRWIAEDGRARVEIYPREPVQDDTAALNRFVAAIQEIAPEAVGAPVIIVEAGRAVEAAFIEAAAIAILGIALLLIVLLRNARDIALVFAPLLLAALLTVAASAAFGLPFNFANVIVLPLLFGLGVAASLNLVIRERQEGNAGTMMTSCTPRAVTFSALTTIGSFGTLALSAHPGIASMGLLLAIAIGLTLASTVLVLPALMAVLRRQRT